MKDTITPNRIKLSKDTFYWMHYYPIPFALIFGGLLLLILDLTTNFSLNTPSMKASLILIATGVSLFFWLRSRLSYKKYLLNGSAVDKFREELVANLSNNGWYFHHNTKKYTVANKKSELLVVYYSKNSCKYCLTGDFIRFGPLFSLIPYYPRGKKILKQMKICT